MTLDVWINKAEMSAITKILLHKEKLKKITLLLVQKSSSQQNLKNYNKSKQRMQYH